MVGAISVALDASPVQHIGKILVMYRPKPDGLQEKAARKLPHHKPRARNKQRRTKRSYQG
jgi:hypothetical protein